MREGEPIEIGNVRLWSRIGREHGAKAISLRILEIAPGVSPGVRNSDCDEVLYLLNGEQPTIVFINGRAHEVQADSGIYLQPKQTLTVRNNGSEPIIMISSRCPEPESTFDFAPPQTSSPSDSARPSPPPIVSLGSEQREDMSPL
jgi:mannose-6-phosphate isomerase-like protein (cupin superfamily)